MKNKIMQYVIQVQMSKSKESKNKYINVLIPFLFGLSQENP